MLLLGLLTFSPNTSREVAHCINSVQPHFPRLFDTRSKRDQSTGCQAWSKPSLAWRGFTAECHQRNVKTCLDK